MDGPAGAEPSYFQQDLSTRGDPALAIRLIFPVAPYAETVARTRVMPSFLLRWEKIICRRVEVFVGRGCKSGRRRGESRRDEW